MAPFFRVYGGPTKGIIPYYNFCFSSNDNHHHPFRGFLRVLTPPSAETGRPLLPSRCLLPRHRVYDFDPIPLQVLWFLTLVFPSRTMFSHGDSRPGFLLGYRRSLNVGLCFAGGNERMTLRLPILLLPGLGPRTLAPSPLTTNIRTRRSEVFVFLLPPANSSSANHFMSSA